LTPQPHDIVKGGSPEPDSAGATGAPEIEVTPAMIAAGVEACGLWDRGDPDEWRVHDIYRRMELARRGTMAI